jgi:hypothetical protein
LQLLILRGLQGLASASGVRTSGRKGSVRASASRRGAFNSLKIADSEKPRLCRKRTCRAFSLSFPGGAPNRRRHSATMASTSSTSTPASASETAGPSTPRAFRLAPIARLL